MPAASPSIEYVIAVVSTTLFVRMPLTVPSPPNVPHADGKLPPNAMPRSNIGRGPPVMFCSADRYFAPSAVGFDGKVVNSVFVTSAETSDHFCNG